MKQGTAEWLKARSGKITGSRVGAILGQSPWQKPDDVLREMVRQYQGAACEIIASDAMQWGTEHEKDAVAEYEKLTGNIVSSLPIVIHPQYSWLAYSPDGHIGDDYLLECKCPASLKIPEQIPDHYMSQVQLGMEVMNLTSTHFVYWTPGETRLFEVARDPAWFESVLPKLQAFYDRFTEELSNPDHLADKVQHIDTAEWSELAREYRYLVAQKDAVSIQIDTVRELLIKLAGDRAAEGAGLKLTPVERKGAIDYSKIPELKTMDLEQYRRAGSRSYRITME